MATLTTKFDMGQKVWRAHTATETRQHRCPDCLGTKTWHVISPAGGEFSVPCPRCSASYRSDDALRLDYVVHAPSATQLTIGKITASMATGDDRDAGTKYMCEETGIGSGSLYRENDLFETQGEALAAAQVMADATNENPDLWVAQQYNKTLRYCDYELKDAKIEAADHRRIASQVRIGMLLDDLNEAESVDDVRREIERYREGAEA